MSVKEQILERVSRLINRIDKDSLDTIEQELCKINTTEQSRYFLKMGYVDSDDSLNVSFNIRVSYVDSDSGNSSNSFESFFKDLVNSIEIEEGNIKIIIETLELLLEVGQLKAKTYPALYLKDQENSIAFMFYLKTAQVNA